MRPLCLASGSFRQLSQSAVHLIQPQTEQALGAKPTRAVGWNCRAAFFAFSGGSHPWLRACELLRGRLQRVYLFESRCPPEPCRSVVALAQKCPSVGRELEAINEADMPFERSK